MTSDEKGIAPVYGVKSDGTSVDLGTGDRYDRDRTEMVSKVTH